MQKWLLLKGTFKVPHHKTRPGPSISCAAADFDRPFPAAFFELGLPRLQVFLSGCLLSVMRRSGTWLKWQRFFWMIPEKQQVG
jgi:hypothetical protein